MSGTSIFYKKGFAGEQTALTRQVKSTPKEPFVSPNHPSSPPHRRRILSGQDVLHIPPQGGTPGSLGHLQYGAVRFDYSATKA